MDRRIGRWMDGDGYMTQLGWRELCEAVLDRTGWRSKSRSGHDMVET